MGRPAPHRARRPRAHRPADAAERLTRLGATLGEGLRVETALLSGRPARRIIDDAEELICEAWRARIRGEVLERKIAAERPGRRGIEV